MFTTPEFVLDITGYTVTSEDVTKAQAILEAYIGKIEQDITDPRDLSILAKATAYQVSYMKNNFNRTFEQAALSQIVQNSNVVTFKAGDDTSPWIAGLTKLACKHLSWRKSRSISTGRIFQAYASRWYQN